ncbi:PAAR domain-containing protein [Vibrio vulnificus]|uniref:PAAR domain-containing protein n=1 Tax=Vibrio vulnificus TaxID=672 RepID=UPI00188D04FA|nr:PAAR domain-containing protein [Vibrio vulnificus]MBF4449873.1 PAAR domain-containing protein [Vibrio vulnificus]MBF4495197.1 PAAR domain-containing protein [Vibrio vulnificus]MBL6179857.1 PAAR domain-containing protein [Vibrio vulnificus]HDY7980022.1 PAAR domain-containing protein [Vibrio vulnificus]HDY8003483.1 PAAR domain-containing protein [Vibrio vulnificus]
MSKPAATIGHNHLCPKKTGKIPHVGGPITTGSSNVMINGVPAARKGDSMVCVGPPDSIKQGSSSVFINGKPAARMFDSTNHGGVIIGGSPNVFIGDAGCYPDSQDSAVASSDSRPQSNEDKQVAPPTKQSNSLLNEPQDLPSSTSHTPANGSSTSSAVDSNTVYPGLSTAQNREPKTFSIVPIRYAIDMERQTPESVLGRGPLSISTPYVLRQLRDGWLYIYDDLTQEITEYKVEGASLTGDANIYLEGTTLHIAFSLIQWTKRIVDTLKQDSSLRHRWMRRVVCIEGGQWHVGDESTLEHVSDMNTCPHDFIMSSVSLREPLKVDFGDEVESNPTADAIMSQLVTSKPTFSAGEWLGNAQGDVTLVVALDDVLSDVLDLTIPLNVPIIENLSITKDEDEFHKLEMARIARSLARVQVPESKWSSNINKSTYPYFEADLHAYFKEREADVTELVAKQQKQSYVSLNTKEHSTHGSKELKILRERWDYVPDELDHKLWFERRKYVDEVNWKKLDRFSNEMESKLGEAETKIDLYMRELYSGLQGADVVDPMRYGIDIYTQEGMNHYIVLTHEIFTTMQLAVQNRERELKKLNEFLAGRNILSFAPYGGSESLSFAVTRELDNAESINLVPHYTNIVGAFDKLKDLMQHGTGRDAIWLRELTEEARAVLDILGKTLKGELSDYLNHLLLYIYPDRLSSPPLLFEIKRAIWWCRIKQEVPRFNDDYINGTQRFRKEFKQLIKELSDEYYKLDKNTIWPVRKYSQYKKLRTSLLEKLVEHPDLISIRADESFRQSRKALHARYMQLVGGKFTQASTAYSSVGGNAALTVLLNSINLNMLSGTLGDTGKGSDVHSKALQDVGIGLMWLISASGDLTKNLVGSYLSKSISDMKTKTVMEIASAKSIKIRGISANRIFVSALVTGAMFGAIASAWEIYKNNRLFLQSNNIYEKGLLLLISSSYLAQFGVYMAVYIRASILNIAVGNLLLPWMVTVGGWVAISTVFIQILYEISKKNEIEKWLSESTWGKSNAKWSKEKELLEYKKIALKPIVEIKEQASVFPYGMEKTTPSSEGYYHASTTKMAVNSPLCRYVCRFYVPDPEQGIVLTILNNAIFIQKSGKWEQEEGQYFYEIAMESRTGLRVNVTYASDESDICYLVSGKGEGQCSVSFNDGREVNGDTYQIIGRK